MLRPAQLLDLSARALARGATRLSGPGTERGALLGLMAVVLTLLVSAGAIAVDVSALERQAQSLQNTADAAALAGVTEWSGTGNKTKARAVIDDIVAQNGVTIGGDISMTVEYPSGSEVKIILTDTTPDAFLGSIVRDRMSSDGGLTRESTARISSCGDACSTEIEIPPPFAAIQATGSGDGFLPILVGSKIYAINHHNYLIECVNRVTESPCWAAKRLIDTPGATFHMVHHYLHGDKIFFSAWDGRYIKEPLETGSLFVSCWDTTLDQRCSDTAHFGHTRGGSLVGIGDRIYLTAGDRKMYCLQAADLSTCPGYSGGRSTALSSEPGWTLDEARANNMDLRVLGSRIYATLANDGKVFMHCFDTAIDAPCPGFGAVHLNNTEDDSARLNYHDYFNGRLFFYRNSLGTATAICSMGSINVECYDLDSAASRSGLAGNLAGVQAQIAADLSGYFMGPVSYNKAANRAFFVTTYKASATHCFDFDTGSYCGGVYTTSPFGPTESYGYVSEGTCLIGLGDAAIFFTIDSDLNSDCDQSGRQFELKPCLCGGQLTWPPVRAENLEDVIVFRARILDPHGNVIVPANPNEWVDMTTDSLDLSGISSSITDITIDTQVEIRSGADPWSAGRAPKLVVGGFVAGGPELVY